MGGGAQTSRTLGGYFSVAGQVRLTLSLVCGVFTGIPSIKCFCVLEKELHPDHKDKDLSQRTVV